MRGFVFFILIQFAPVFLRAQTVFRIMEYNVENLFDLQHDTGHSDQEFLPEGNKRWNAYKYWKKQQSISRVVAAVGERHIPDLIVLCEIENDTVIRDLCKRSSLRTLGYRSIQTASEDKRGIDVAVLYQPGRFRLLQADTIRIASQQQGFRPTRDILYVQGKIVTGDTLHLIACHFPSKYDGTRAVDRHRMLAAQTLASVGDSIFRRNASANIVVTGDFNAGPNENVFRKSILKEIRWHVLPSRSMNVRQDVRGTYRYQGHWGSLDHFIVSESLLSSDSRLFLSDSVAHIADYSFLLERDLKYGGFKPFRTYLGPRYQGGYSDHLPLFIDFLIRFE